MITFNGKISDGTVICRGPRVSDFNFDLNTISRDEVAIPGSTADHTLKDVTYTTNSAATIDHNFDVVLENSAGSYRTQFASQDPSIATVDSSTGRVALVADGTAQITARINPLLMKKVSRAISREAGASTNAFKSFVTGSLAKNINDFIVAAILNKTASVTTLSLYSTLIDGVTYVRNSNLFVSAVDWTCLPAVNSFAGGKFCGTVIADDCILGCNHATLPNGTTIYFVAADGTIITRTSIGAATVSGRDLRAIALDSPLPNTIHVCKVPPSNFLTARLPGFPWGIPIVRANQFRELHLYTSYEATTGVMGVAGYPNVASMQPWYTPIVSGDSGSGMFMVVNGEPLFIAVLSGATIHDNIAAINTAMTSAGSIRTLTQMSLSSFTDFT